MQSSDDIIDGVHRVMFPTLDTLVQAKWVYTQSISVIVLPNADHGIHLSARPSWR